MLTSALKGNVSLQQSRIYWTREDAPIGNPDMMARAVRYFDVPISPYEFAVTALEPIQKGRGSFTGQDCCIVANEFVECVRRSVPSNRTHPLLKGFMAQSALRKTFTEVLRHVAAETLLDGLDAYADRPDLIFPHTHCPSERGNPKVFYLRWADKPLEALQSRLSHQVNVRNGAPFLDASLWVQLSDPADITW